jgi:hypothetical protein
MHDLHATEKIEKVSTDRNMQSSLSCTLSVFQVLLLTQGEKFLAIYKISVLSFLTAA